MKRYEEAIQDYNIAIHIDPEEPVLYTNRGDVYHVIGEYDLALVDYQKALDLDPNNEDAKNNIEMLQ